MTKSRDTANIIKQPFTQTLGTSNYRAGVNAGNSIASGGNYNVTVGDEAGTALTVGDESVAVGFEALMTVTSGAENVGVGYRALKLTTGNSNVAVGKNALTTNSSGSNNTALGTSALFSNTTASNNVAVGYQAGYANTGDKNTFVGKEAGAANTTGRLNTMLGQRAGVNNTTSSSNTFVGQASGELNTTGGSNTALGDQSLKANTTASFNTALGYQAGLSNVTGDDQTFLGYKAGRLTTGTDNTFVGASSGSGITSGAKNTILGKFNGNQGGLDIRTSSNNIVLSDGDGNPVGYRRGADGNWYFDNVNNNEYAMRVRSTGTGGNPYGLALQYTNVAPNNDSGRFLTCFDSSNIRLKIFNNGNVVNQNNSYGADSDLKLKENIVDASSQWDDIKALTVRKYSLKEDNLDAPNMLGVIAQELESAGMNGLVKEIADVDKDMNDLGTTTKSVNYSILYMKAVKALQEAMTRIETLETKVTALEG